MLQLVISRMTTGGRGVNGGDVEFMAVSSG
jgi:hypothetical protein